MQLLLIALGLIPLALGGLLSWSISTLHSFLLPLWLTAVGLLLLWGLIAFIMRPHVKSAKEVVLLLNLMPTLDFVLVLIQNLLFGGFWFNAIGLWSQVFYLPLVFVSTIENALTGVANFGLISYCISFALLIAASVVGCMLNKKRAS